MLEPEHCSRGQQEHRTARLGGPWASENRGEQSSLQKIAPDYGAESHKQGPEHCFLELLASKVVTQPSPWGSENCGQGEQRKSVHEDVWDLRMQDRTAMRLNPSDSGNCSQQEQHTTAHDHDEARLAGPERCSLGQVVYMTEKLRDP